MILRYAKQFVFVALVLITIRSEGTTCVEVSQRRALLAADVVFSGTVTSIEQVGQEREIPMGSLSKPLISRTVMVTFKVDHGWKGPVKATMTIIAFEHPAMGSGFVFRVGRRYVVYGKRDPSTSASGKDERITIGLPCTLRIREDVNAETARLGHGFTPQR